MGDGRRWRILRCSPRAGLKLLCDRKGVGKAGGRPSTMTVAEGPAPPVTSARTTLPPGTAPTTSVAGAVPDASVTTGPETEPPPDPATSVKSTGAPGTATPHPSYTIADNAAAARIATRDGTGVRVT